MTMNDKAETLLEAAGLKRTENGWRFIPYDHVPQDIRDEADIPPDRGFSVTKESNGSFLVAYDSYKNTQLVFRSEDARDVVAFASGEVADIYAQIGRHNDIPRWSVFVHADCMAVHHAFMSDPHHDFDVVSQSNIDGPGPRQLWIAHPSGAFPEYTDWRDAYCARLLSEPAATPRV